MVLELAIINLLMTLMFQTITTINPNQLTQRRWVKQVIHRMLRIRQLEVDSLDKEKLKMG